MGVAGALSRGITYYRLRCEKASQHIEGTTMSHHTRASSASRLPTKVALMSQAILKTWTQARLTDRELMALRTNLSRHSG